MKTITISTFFVLFAIVAGIAATAPSAFADHADAHVSVPAGSSVPGCEETNECWLPATVTIDVGGEVTWSNDDTAAHTVTSGSAADGPDGNFDSSLFMAGTTFSATFDTAGEYPYFCMVHPWMQGMVVAQVAESEQMRDEEHEGEVGGHMDTEGIVGMTADGEYMVTLWPAKPIDGAKMVIALGVTDENGGSTEHLNYDMKVTQNGKVVLDVQGAHDHDGSNEHQTTPLDSADPVDIEVTIQGFGIDPPFTGPTDETVVFSSVVPEFGTIAVMILGVSIISIIAVTARSKVIPRL